jgi:AcrR family transcriptional regulator
VTTARRPADAPRRPGRPRSDESRRAILAATLELLASHGFGGLTMSGVASRAGASTATVYRWWRSKIDLVVDAVTSIGGDQPVPDTGSLHGDCKEFALRIIDVLTGTSTGPVVVGLVGDANRHPELAQALREHVLAERLPGDVAMLLRAVARGEMDPGVDPELALELLVGPIYTRLLVTGREISPDLADQLADLVVHAVAPRR